MTDTPVIPAAPPAAPATPAITFGGDPGGGTPDPKPTDAPDPAASKTPETPDKFEFSFEGDDEKYSFDEKLDDGDAPTDAYDSSKPFDPKIEEALKGQPELLKALKQGHYELRQWKGTGFKNPAELKAYKGRIEAIGGPEAIEKESQEWTSTLQGFQNGDPAVLDKWATENPDGMVKLSGPMLDWLHKSNPEVWSGHMSKVFMATLRAPNDQGISPLAAFNQLYDIPEIKDSPAAQKLLKQIADTINTVNAVSKKDPEATAPRGGGKESQKLETERRGIFLEKVNMQASPVIEAAAKQAMKVALKGLTISKEAEADILADIKRQFNAIQKADPDFQKNAKDLLAKQDIDRFVKVLKSAIARNMPRAALREARKYKGLSGNTEKRKAESQTRLEAGGGGAGAGNRIRYTGPFKQGGPDPAQIDYQGMRAQFGRKGTDEMLQRHEFFKKGGDGKTVYFW